VKAFFKRKDVEVNMQRMESKEAMQEMMNVDEAVFRIDDGKICLRTAEPGFVYLLSKICLPVRQPIELRKNGSSVSLT
jgi:hypothetical protein